MELTACGVVHLAKQIIFMKMTLNLSLDQVIRGGESVYRELRNKLEAKHMGHYVVIDVEAKKHFVNADRLAAIEEAREAQGPKMFYIVQVGDFHPSYL